MRKLFLATVAIAIVTVGARQAEAQVSITPFAGATFNGDAPTSKLSMGAAVSFLGDMAGAEVEFGYTPDFFNENDSLVLIGNNNVTSLSANVLIGPKLGFVRPYGTIGVGLLRTSVDSGSDLFEDLSLNDWAMNAGAGVMISLTDHVGVRGDARYFRSLEDRSPNSSTVDLGIGTFDFWRVYAGVTFR